MTATKRARSTSGSDNVWTDEERAAVQATARERKSQSRLSPQEEREAGEQEVRAKIAEMPTPDREMGERMHALVTETASVLVPRTYYGMPAYAKDGKVICFFQSAEKFKARYATLGFNDGAKLDAGAMWPTSYALTKLGPADEKKIASLVKKAVS